MTAKILGHDRQIEIISNAIKRRNIPNAWLFFGSRGIGKALLAQKVAHLLASINFKNQETIDKFSSRTLIEMRIKSDIRNIYYCQRLKEEKKAKKNKFISIADIRDMQKAFSLASVDETYRTCIIDSADDLNLESSNAILKILEEPPEKTLFIIICHNIQCVIPTIVSRCQKIQFHNLGKPEMVEISESVFNDTKVDIEKKKQLLKISNGSPGKFSLLLDEEFLSILIKIESITSEFPKFDYDKIKDLIFEHPKYSTWENKDRSILNIFLIFISHIIHELIELSSSNSSTSNDILLKKLNEIPDIQLLIAHMYSQIVFLSSEAQKFNFDARKVIFLSFSLFEKLYKQQSP